MNVEKLTNFKCYKVLPLVYDDSLSYYEVLCKLTNKINEVIESINSTYEEKIKEAVDKYFNTIMINAIYNESAESITLSKESTSTSGDTHTYNYTDNSMTIS